MSGKRWLKVSPKGEFSCTVEVSEKKNKGFLEFLPKNIYRYYKQHVNPEGEDFTELYETGDMLAQTPLEILYFQIMDGKEFTVPIVDYQFVSLLEYLSFPGDQKEDPRFSIQSEDQLTRLIEYIVGYLQISPSSDYLSWAIRLHFKSIGKELYDSLTSAGSLYTPPMEEKRYMEIIETFFAFFEKYSKMKGLTDGLVLLLQESTLRSRYLSESSHEYKTFPDRLALNGGRTTFSNHIDCSRFLLKLLIYKVYYQTLQEKVIKIGERWVRLTDSLIKDPSNFLWMKGNIPSRWVTIFRFSKTPYGSLVCDDKFIEDFAKACTM